MPSTLSASDYTKFVKYQAAQLAYANNQVPRPIQTVDQVAPNQTILNSYLKTSQAAYVVTPTQTALSGLNYVRPMPPNNVNHPKALSTISSGTLSSSRTRLR
jgi:hypothetical protein